jgi:large subunit ribosomal protein L13
MRTRLTPTAEAVAGRQWWLIDLDGQILGRAAIRIAHIVRGKYKPTFTPNIDDGDFVVVINADKVALSGKKWDKKTYYRHTGYVGGLKSASAREVHERNPEDLIRLAVKGMLPSGPLGRAQLRKVKIYAGADHPHVAQVPKSINITGDIA